MGSEMCIRDSHSGESAGARAHVAHTCARVTRRDVTEMMTHARGLFVFFPWLPCQDSPAEQKVTWAQIKTALAPVIKKVVDGKFHEPRASDDEIATYYNAIADEVTTAFQQFTDAL